MNENITKFAKIAGLAFLQWIIVVATGFILNIILFFVALFQNLPDIGMASHGGGGILIVVFVLIGLLVENPFAFILVVGAPFFIIGYFAIANKISIRYSIDQVWKTKLSDVIITRLKKIIDKITNNSDRITAFSDATVLRAKLLDANRNDLQGSGIQRKILNYIFKKIKLDKVDFKDENLKLSDVISEQLHRFVSEFAKPSYRWFWILLIFQILVYIISLFFRG